MSPAPACCDAVAQSGADQYHAYLEAIGKIFFHVYASSAVRPFDSSELQQLLEKSRENNAALGVSGMLLYKDGNFLQVLEGREAAVHALAEKIHRDPRHNRVTTLLEGFESEYQFPAWSMGFRDLELEEAKTTAGYSDFLDTAFNPRAFATDPTVAQSLLLIFKEAT